MLCLKFLWSAFTFVLMSYIPASIMSFEAQAWTKTTPQGIIAIYAYANGLIVKLFLKQSGSNRVSCCFNTRAKRKYLRLRWLEALTWLALWQSYNASHKVRQLVIQGFGSVFFKNRRVTKSLTWHTQSIRKELEGWREGQIWQHYFAKV